jgi:hypothetical protein
MRAEVTQTNRKGGRREGESSELANQQHMSRNA